MLLVLLLLVVLPGSLAEEQKMPALQEEFNVLVYGTLQLGQALRDTYSSTNDKLQRVATRYGKLERKLGGLEVEVARVKQEMGRIGQKVDSLQREEQERRTVNQRVADDLRDAQTQYTELQRRVQDLEKGAQDKEQLIPSFLKRRVERQNLLLQVISEESERQRKQMAGQRGRLLTILKQASAIASR
ncbi:angiopoietin-like protein 8 [Engystomops pustulosus]|uniref:angiopoietin-like protein 8 n=1 Tax=Engystomops pustulosus TaxID=76066 RepID=UPI003AFA5903